MTAYLSIYDIPASWAEYHAVAAGLETDVTGLLLYVAGPTDEGVRIVTVWHSRNACRRFHANEVGPVLAELGAGATTSIRELQAAVVRGPLAAESNPEQTDKEVHE